MITSKNTSVNTKNLPAIWKIIDWYHYKGKIVVDFGCGRPKTQELVRNYLSWWDITYVPYDPYWCTAEQNRYALNILQHGQASALVCTNVLNVIHSDKELYKIIENLVDWTFELKMEMSPDGLQNRRTWEYRCDTFISVYEGDKSEVGRLTKKDCWQRNLPKEWYYEKLCHKIHPISDIWDMKYGIITNQKYMLHK